MRTKGQLLLINPWIYDFAAYNSWIEPLGLLEIAAALRDNGYSVTLLDCLAPHSGMPRPHANGSGKLLKTAVDKPLAVACVPRRFGRYGLPVEQFEAALAAAPTPDLVLVASGMTYWYPGVAEAIRRVRARFGGVPVAVGGVYASLCPDHARCFSGADEVIAGPGVVAALRLADQATGHDSGPDRLADPRSWPAPAHDLTPRPYAAVLTAWGCPYRCTYCAGHRLQPAFVRREPDMVIEEIAACARRGIRRFVFYDDALIIDAERHLVPILEGVLARRLPASFYPQWPSRGDHGRAGHLDARPVLSRPPLAGDGLSGPAASHRHKVTTADFETAVKHLKAAGFGLADLRGYLHCPPATLGRDEDSLRFILAWEYRSK